MYSHFPFLNLIGFHQSNNNSRLSNWSNLSLTKSPLLWFETKTFPFEKGKEYHLAIKAIKFVEFEQTNMLIRESLLR